MSKHICSIEECGRPTKARSMCNAHYRRASRYGDPHKGGPIMERGKYAHCTIDGCTDPHDARGYCQRHYAQARRDGDGPALSECVIDGCQRHSASSQGWCWTHYRRWQDHGDPERIPMRERSERERFYSRTERRGGCLIWTGNRNGRGYGTWTPKEGVRFLAHRRSLELSGVVLGVGQYVDHICHTPLCVEPSHLRGVTPGENTWNLRGARRNSQTGVRNVSITRQGRYIVRVKKSGVVHRAGPFNSLDEAAIAAESLRLDLFGQYAGPTPHLAALEAVGLDAHPEHKEPS